MNMWIRGLFLLVTVAVVVVHGAIDADEVTALPGLEYNPSYKHYSGYLDAGGTKRLHYWFVESQNEPATDPLVLWLNGGPGCSSLDGLLNEHGPFLITSDGRTLVENHYSWNKVANMLYLESPAGVGLSYSEENSYATNDDQVSMDNYNALHDFLQLYPEFASNDFYIAGESYGGIYAPTLSVRVMEDNAFNFKGFAVGNGLSNETMNDISELYFSYYRGLIGEDLLQRLVGSCNTDNLHNLDCSYAYADYFVLMTGVNYYNVYDECHTTPNSMPCINSSAITTYLNDHDVRDALHIPEGVQPWVLCSMGVYWTYTRQYPDVGEQYLEVLRGGAESYRILVYNGDIDLRVNVVGNEWFIDSLNLPQTKQWQPWYYASPMDGSSQVGGFTKQYGNLAFFTVKGGSHSVPNSSPAQAFTLFDNFINGKM